MKPTLIDLEAAWEIIEKQTPVLSSESVRLEDALGRVLAQDVLADRDYPAFDRSAMDGFAVRSVDVESASGEAPVRLRIVGEATPGNAFAGAGDKGSAVRIMTGAPVPAEWDSVVPVEQTSGFDPEAEFVQILSSVRSRQHIARRAVERQEGARIYQAGQRLDAAAIGVLAMVGAGRVQVAKRPSVSVLATGNELVRYLDVPGPTSIRNSNSPMLAALARPHCGDVRILGPAADRRPDLDALVSQALAADLLLVTGGVSMGAYDLVGAALLDAGVHVHFERVALQPGKPVTFGTHETGIVLALPGNPVSAYTTFRLFARPALSRLQGQTSVRPFWSLAPAVFEWQRRNAKWLLLPGKLSAAPLAVERVRYTGSGDLMAFAGANCQIVLPPKQERVSRGEPVAIWRI